MTPQPKPVFEPKTQAFINALSAQGGKPLYQLSYADARKVLEDAQAVPVAKLPADIEEKILPAGPTGEVSVRIYRPKNAKGLRSEEHTSELQSHSDLVCRLLL